MRYVECSQHPARGGPHLSPGLVVGPYFDHEATLVMCTYRNKKGKECGDVFMVPGWVRAEPCVWCGSYLGSVQPYKFGGVGAPMHEGCAREARALH